jgi:riboflavin synthase
MFTGIITDIGKVLAVTPRAQELRRVKIGCSYERASIALGASIACAGACLTVVEVEGEGDRTVFLVDIAAETLAVTTAGSWRPGTRLNLERSLRLGDELSGHLVSGHIDGLAEVVAREDLTDMVRFTLRAPRILARFLAPKGSVALDGISLTINGVDGDSFSVLIIPHTLRATTFGDCRIGGLVNLEVDMMARYVARIVNSKESDTPAV